MKIQKINDFLIEKKKDTVCIIHHDDLDGFSSANIVHEFYYKNYNIKFIKYFYKESEEINKLFDKKQYFKLVMVDCSLLFEDMLKLKKLYDNDFIWIDHHISKIKDSEKYKYDDLKGIRKDGDAATLLCYKYYFPENDIKDGLKYIDMFDTFKNSDKEIFENTILPFFYGCSLKTESVDKYDKKILGFNISDKDYKEYINNIINDGKLIQKYLAIENSKKCEDNIFEIKIEDYKILMMNSNIKNSMIFDSVKELQKKYDMISVFNFNGENWSFSLYSDKKNIDCSKLATKFKGGGGHKGASGFFLNNDEFIKLIKQAKKII
jgi:oligoribonuclease NrnB/cAMP/cGMP phosphodiesterase (DHH superfamily)